MEQDKIHTHVILVNGIVVKQHKILIVKRGVKEANQPGKWSIPGGKVEKTKGNIWKIIEKTLVKEIKEEVGIEVKRNLELLTNNTFIRSTGHHVVTLVFLCVWKSGRARPLEDTDATKWINLDELGLYNFAPNVKRYIKKGFSRIQ